MPKYVLSYFPIQALGESIRLLLAYGKEDWEDRRIPSEEWPKYKPQSPFSQMPVLEVDGKKYAQSIPITRWLGRKNGLAGKNADEDLIIDQNVEYINDVRIKAGQVHYEPDPVLKEKKFAIASKEVYPPMLERLDQMIKQTWGDFYLVGLLEYYKDMARIPDLEQQYPSVKKIKDEVLSIPQVKAYFDAAYPA